MSNDFVIGEERRQSLLLPSSLEEYVDEENEVRFIDAFVGMLDMKALGFKHFEPTGGVGRAPYDPRDLLKLFIWGYLNQIRSSRKLERECRRDTEVMWLVKKLTPDFKTISNFRKENIDSIRKVFKEFVFLCRELDLFGAKLVGIDGVKLKAVNSTDRNVNKKSLAYRLKKIDGRIEKYLREIEELDSEDEEYDISSSSGHNNEPNAPAILLREKLGKLKEKKTEYNRLLNELNSSGRFEISLTDPDSRLMKNNRKLDVCYNAHAAVDSKNHLVADYDVTNIASDNISLSSVAKSAKDTLGIDRIEATADKGFFSQKEIKECVDNGIIPYVPEPDKSTSGKAKSLGIPQPAFYENKFVYDRLSNTYTCPAGQKLKFTYWDNKGEGRVAGIYMTDDGACFSCPFFMTKCTKNKIGRTIQRWEHEELLEEMKMRIKRDPLKMMTRSQICEHPFGTVKRAFNQGYLLLKGLRKVTGEVGFTFLAYNMRRAINIIGTKALITAICS